MEVPERPELPETLQALRKLENSKLESEIKKDSASTDMISPLEPGKDGALGTDDKTKTTETKYLFKLIPWSGRVGIFFKVLTVLAGIVTGFLLLFALLTLTSIDLSLVKLSLSGQVVSASGNIIVGAAVTIDEQSAITNNNGEFIITGLSVGRFDIEITADGYETLVEEVPIARTFLNYTTDKVFVMKASGIGSISGKFVTTDASYDFSSDHIEINNLDRYKINTDGTFLIPNLQTGQINFAYISTDYMDIVQEFHLNDGTNALADFTLTPAGDIEVSTISYVTETIVTDLLVTMQDTTREQIEISEEGKLVIKDLEVDKDYALKIEHADYEPREYAIKIKQGINIIPDFQVVEKGRIPFIASIEQKKYLVVTDYDGRDQKTLGDQDLESYGEYAENNDVYFLSTRDNIRSELGGYALLAYTVDAYSGEPTRLTSNYDDLGRVIPNFRASKLANVTAGTERSHRVLEVMNLNGNDRVEIYYTETGIFSDVVMADSGSYIYFYVQDTEEIENGLYRGDMRTGQTKKLFDGENILIYDVSPSGDKVLYSATNTETDLTDLHIYQSSNGNDSVVRNAINGSSYQFLEGSESILLYFLNVSGGSNMYTLDTATNAETQLTNFSGTEGVEAVYQQEGYIFYQTNKGLYIMDFSAPKRDKVVSNSIVRYTGYDF